MTYINRQFKKGLKRAKRKGWAVPGEHQQINKASWLFYWQAMEEKARHKTEGRPIPPHRPA